MRGWPQIFLVLLCLAGATPAWAGQALLIQGIEAQKAGRNEQAVELLGQYLRKYPQIAEARRYRALALAALERKAEALEEVSRGLKDNAQDCGLLLAYGAILSGMERRPEAIATFSRVVVLDPKNAEAFKERGENQAQEGCFVAAIEDFNRAAALAPKDPWVYNKRGMAWFCQGQFDKAVADFSTAIRLAPNSPHAYFFRGNMYRHHLGQPEKAAADYQKACRLGHPLACRELEKQTEKPEK